MKGRIAGGISLIVGALVIAGCGKDEARESPGAAAGAGGAAGAETGSAAGEAATGGAAPEGGGAVTGGRDPMGGAATGGGEPAGGAPASGGTPDTGGSGPASGGAGGEPDAGGAPTGGTAGSTASQGGDSAGSVPASGGVTPTSGGAAGASAGGTIPAGGAHEDGGRAGRGGATGDGGASGEGGGPGVPDGGYRLEGVNGRVEVVVLPGIEPSSWSDVASVTAQIFDGPLRLDAFAPYPAGLHEVAIAEGDCTLLVAAELACDPPCDWDRYCGAGGACVPTPQAANAGALVVAGERSAKTLTFADGFYSQAELPATDVTGPVAATAAGAAVAGFALETAGVGAPDFDLPEDGRLTLVDGEDYRITWTPAPRGVVQLLLNSGWHGAPPVATLVCEVAASAGRLVIPRAIVEAYPPESGFGLFPHSSYLTLFERDRATVEGGVVELVVGWRQGVYVLH